MPIRVNVPGVGVVNFPDGMSQEQITAEVRTLTASPPTAPPAPASVPAETPTTTVGDVLGGLRSSAARTVYGGGDLIRRATNAVLPGERFDLARRVTEPRVQAWMTAPPSAAGTVGSVTGDVAQFFLPTGVQKYKKSAEALKAGALTYAQTGSPVQALGSMATTAVMPGAATLLRGSKAARESAEKTVAQALGATKERLKEEATKLAPQMLERGVGGSRAAMLERARAMTTSLGPQLDATYAAAAAAGQTVPGTAIRQTVQQAADAFKVVNAAGARVPIPGTQTLVQRLDDLDQFIATLGADIPVDRAAVLKQTWDDIISTAGLFGSKATASATDKAEARAIKTASDSFRDLLNTNPTIADLNRELSFWIGLKKVLKATEQRTQAQSGGLVSAGVGGAGAVVGAMTGEDVTDRAQNAVLGGLAGRQLVRVVQSPYFRTQVSGPLKNLLAEALASGQTGRILGALGKITASLPAQYRPAPAAPAQ